MATQWQRRSAVAALLWTFAHMAVADGVTIVGPIDFIHIGNFVFCASQQTGPNVSPASSAEPQCNLEATQIVIDPYGHSVNKATISTTSIGSISAPSCHGRSNPRVHTRLLGTHVVGCKP